MGWIDFIEADFLWLNVFPLTNSSIYKYSNISSWPDVFTKYWKYKEAISNLENMLHCWE